jgi:beta-lactamase regulating signal transducer with metallopeptidase domain
MASSFFKIYLAANLLLSLSYISFLLTQKALQLLKMRIEPQLLVRWAQGLLLAAAISPMIFASLPGRELPEVKMPSFRQPSESGRKIDLGLSQRNPKNFNSRMALTSPEMALGGLARLSRWLEGSSWMDLAILAWAFGCFYCLTRLILSLARLSKLLRASSLMHKFGRVRISVSSELSVPICVYGFGKRWVVLPMQLLDQRSDFKIALRHELQHHRQGDTQWSLAVEWLVCFFYLNPAAYLWKRMIIELQEFSCDEALVGQQRVSSREYGSCLLRVAEAALGSREVYAGTAYMATAAKNPNYYKSFLRRRIEMLANKNKPSPRKWIGLSVGTLGILATVSIAYGVERSARSAINNLPNAGTVVVDETIQRITQKILADAVASQDASEAFAIVADPQTGRVLAVANIDTTGKKSGHWALSQQLEPASIAKTLLAAEAIEQGKTTPEESHNCENGNYKFGGQVFHDWKKEGWESLTTTQAIAKSSDICTVKIAEKLGLNGVHNLLEKYGFGPEGTARSFPESRTGQLPPRDGPAGKFFVPLVAYGQGFRSTAIELVQAYGAIANGGNLLMPLAANALDSDIKIVRRVLSSENAAKVKTILREVVLSGTGRENAGSYLYTTAGKTASFFSPDEDWLESSRGTRKANMAGFIGFAPLANPRVEVYVTVLNPKVSVVRDGGAHGAEHAAPIFKHIAEAVLQEMKVAPDNL